MWLHRRVSSAGAAGLTVRLSTSPSSSSISRGRWIEELPLTRTASTSAIFTTRRPRLVVAWVKAKWHSSSIFPFAISVNCWPLSSYASCRKLRLTQSLKLRARMSRAFSGRLARAAALRRPTVKRWLKGSISCKSSARAFRYRRLRARREHWCPKLRLTSEKSIRALLQIKII